MPKVKIDLPAPDFTRADYLGNIVRVQDFQEKSNVILVFNRGFVWPFCRRHMAQLRQEYGKFKSLKTDIIVLGPESPEAFNTYFQKENLPFIGIPDPTHSILKLYGQEIKLFKLGRMPAQVIIDKKGIVRFTHYGHSMSDIPGNDEVLEILTELS